MKNTEISRILGEQWRNASEEERRPHVEKELRERSKYKAAVEEFNRGEAARKEEERKAAAQFAALAAAQQQQVKAFMPSAQHYDASYRFIQHNTTSNVRDHYTYTTSRIPLINSRLYDSGTNHQALWNTRQASSQSLFRLNSSEISSESNDNLMSFLEHDGHTPVPEF